MIANANVLVERLTERAMFMLDEISNWMKEAHQKHKYELSEFLTLSCLIVTKNHTYLNKAVGFSFV